MNKFLLADMLNGREYLKEITPDIKEVLKGTDLVIVYGASDDLMKFGGAIQDEIDCFGGGNAYLTNKGMLENKCEYGDCPYYQLEKEKASFISAVWDYNGYSWIYNTNIPHAAFDILEDGEKYCRGIVFNLSEVVY